LSDQPRQGDQSLREICAQQGAVQAVWSQIAVDYFQTTLLDTSSRVFSLSLQSGQPVSSKVCQTVQAVLFPPTTAPLLALQDGDETFDFSSEGGASLETLCNAVVPSSDYVHHGDDFMLFSVIKAVAGCAKTVPFSPTLNDHTSSAVVRCLRIISADPV
jgi:hypothetical protein